MASIRSYNSQGRKTTGPGDADEAVVIRRAGADDREALRRLAALDTSPPLAGEVLVAEVDGELRAARSLEDGRTIADPFRRTLTLRALLELRARQLEAEPDGASVHRLGPPRGEPGLPRTA